jgi:hypothetical protein
MAQFSSERCRIELDHIDPSSKYTQSELEEFFHATEVLTAQYRQNSIASLSQQPSLQQPQHPSPQPKRKSRHWSDTELYSLLLAVSIIKSREPSKIAASFEGRTEKEVISKSFLFFCLLLFCFHLHSSTICVIIYKAIMDKALLLRIFSRSLKVS